MRIWLPLTLLALAVPLTGHAKVRSKAKIQVQGHRGARALRPENTLPAFDYALEAGVDVLELDLLMTKDDRLVVMHDPHVSPVLCSGPRGRAVPKGLAVRTLTLAKLQTFDCGAKKNPRFPKQQPVPGTRIPTFEAVLDHVLASKHPSAQRVHFNIETKLEPAHPELFGRPKAIAARVVRLLKARGLLDRAVLQSFDARTLVAAKALAPTLRTSMLISDNAPPLVPIAKALGASFISPHHEWITAENVRELHAAGIKVVPWTANDAAAWQRLVAMEVDGIISDDPAALIAWLTQRGLR